MAKAFNLKWTTGNSKLNKDNGGVYNIVGYGIPADTDFQHNGETLNTCPSALACRGVCYAKQGMYRTKQVVDARKHNLDMSLRSDFVDNAIADIKRMRKVNVIRIHDSGDYYSQEYLDKWITIANAFPHIIFYSYTKSLNLDFSNKPDNLHITQSLGGKHDNLVNLNMPHARIFSTDEDRIRAGYVDGNRNDVLAIEGEIKQGLVFHGNKKLTPAQQKYFS